MKIPTDYRAEVTVNGVPVGRFDVTIESTNRYQDVRTDPDRPMLSRSWRYTDHHGHEHRGDDLSATMLEVRIRCYCSTVDEPHDVHDHWECRQCGEVIKPGTEPGGMFRLSVGVSTRIRLDGPGVAQALHAQDYRTPVELVIKHPDGPEETRCRAIYRDSAIGYVTSYATFDVVEGA